MTVLMDFITTKNSTRLGNCCVTSSKSLNLSVPQFFSSMEEANKSTYLIGL